MKKSYTRLMAMIALVLFSGLSLQAQWNVHRLGTNDRAEVAQADKNSELLIGYCSNEDFEYGIQEQTGLSLSMDSRVGVGIILDREMIEPYIGGIISAIYVGWDDRASTAEYECFVKKESFNGDVVTSATATVGYGWSRVDVTPARIPDVEQLCVGFYTHLKADVISIPFVNSYGNCPDHSVILHSDEHDADGNELWYDMSGVAGFDKMPVMLVIMDSSGKYQNYVMISDIRTNKIATNYTQNNAEIQLRNAGSNEVSSLEIQTYFNGDSLSDVIEFEEPIKPNDNVKRTIPIYCLGTGVHVVSVLSVNEQTPKIYSQAEVEMIGVDPEVSEQYNHMPLLEYFVSEESYMCPKYLDEMFWPGIDQFKDRYNIVFHHIDDKYMWGDNEALRHMVKLCDYDSLKVLVPGLTVNRSDYLEYTAVLANTPFLFGTPFPDTIDPDRPPLTANMWNGILQNPTFASVQISARFDANNENINIEISGNIAEGVMPEEEDVYITVYLMERDVKSEDQLFWSDEEKEQAKGEYVHKNVIRDILTDYYGDALPQREGEYSCSFSVENYDEWSSSNLYVVAFLHRDENNPHMDRQVINSNLCDVEYTNSVNDIANDRELIITTADGAVLVNGSTQGVEVYNVAGVGLANENLAQGVYVIRYENVTTKVVVR